MLKLVVKIKIFCNIAHYFQQNYFDGLTKLFSDPVRLFSKILDPSAKSFFP